MHRIFLQLFFLLLLLLLLFFSCIFRCSKRLFGFQTFFGDHSSISDTFCIAHLRFCLCLPLGCQTAYFSDNAEATISLIRCDSLHPKMSLNIFFKNVQNCVVSSIVAFVTLFFFPFSTPLSSVHR